MKKNTLATPVSAHINHTGSLGFNLLSPVKRLKMMAASSFFGEPAYYIEPGLKSKSGKINSADASFTLDYLISVLGGTITPPASTHKSTAGQMEKAIDDSLDFDLEETLKVAVELRNEDNIRTTPQVILVRAAHHAKSKGTGLIRKYAPDIIKRADEPSVQLAYQFYRYGKTIPNSLKKAWKDKLESLTEFQLAKYRMESRQVKTIDVVRMSHASSDPIKKLVHGELKLSNTDTWESMISSLGSTTDTWTKAVDSMGHMALLRNLSNLHEKKVDQSLYLNKLVSTVKGGNQLPFRYYSAYNVLLQKNASSKILKAVEQAMETSLENLPTFKGNVASLCDNSGSAHGAFTSTYGSTSVANIANLTAVITSKLVDGNSSVFPFGDELKRVDVNKSKGIFKIVKEVEAQAKKVGQSTETGIWKFWQAAIKEKQHWDHIFIYSDMQAGHGQLYASETLPKNFCWPGSTNNTYRTYVDVPSLIAEYRKVVNPDVFVYLVQVAGYGDSIVPDIFDKTFVLGGWSDGIFKFAHKMSELQANTNVTDLP